MSFDIATLDDLEATIRAQELWRSVNGCTAPTVFAPAWSDGTAADECGDTWWLEMATGESERPRVIR